MKIEQVLIHYLIKTKKLSLQGIGIFLLEGTVAESSDPNKPITIPEGAVTFTHDPRVSEDPGLVSFIVEYTGKILPLASADLDSYLMLGRQFLNIGNPMILPGIGTIEKTNSGNLVFRGGMHLAERMEANRAKIEDEGAEPHDEDMFNDYQRETKSKAGRTILIFIGILIIGLIIWAIWRYAFNAVNEPENVTQATYPPAPVSDTQVTNDSANAAITPPGLTTSSTALPDDTFTFKAVVNEYDNLPAAQARYNKLQSYGRKVGIYTSDSLTYKIAEPFNRPLSDTTKVKDSLNAYYGPGRTVLEYQR